MLRTWYFILKAVENPREGQLYQSCILEKELLSPVGYIFEKLTRGTTRGP